MRRSHHHRVHSLYAKERRLPLMRLRQPPEKLSSGATKPHAIDTAFQLPGPEQSQNRTLNDQEIAWSEGWVDHTYGHGQGGGAGTDRLTAPLWDH